MTDDDREGTTYEELVKTRNHVSHLEEELDAVIERADRLEDDLADAYQRIEDLEAAVESIVEDEAVIDGDDIPDEEDVRETEQQAGEEHPDPFVRAARRSRERRLSSSDGGGDEE